MIEIRPAHIIKVAKEWVQDLGNLYGEVMREEKKARYVQTPVNISRQLELEEISRQLDRQGKPALVRKLLLD